MAFWAALAKHAELLKAMAFESSQRATAKFETLASSPVNTQFKPLCG
jgi:hypothetical protein